MPSIITPAPVQYFSDLVRDFEMRRLTSLSVLLIWPLDFRNNNFLFILQFIWYGLKTRIILSENCSFKWNILLVFYLYACI